MHPNKQTRWDTVENVYNLRSILLFIALLQGVVIAGMLLVRGLRQHRGQDFYLAGLLFFLSASLIEHFIGFMGVYDYAREHGFDLTFFPFSNRFVWGPLIWLYTCALTDGEFKWRRGLWGHFIVPILHYVIHFGVWLLPLDTKNALFGTSFFTVHGYLDAAVFYIQIGMYLAWSLRRYWDYRRLINTEFSNTDRLILVWLRNFLFGFSVYLVIDLTFNVVGVFYQLRYVDWYWLEITRAVHLYYLSVTGWAFAQKSIVPYIALEKREGGSTEANFIHTSAQPEKSLGKTLFSPEESIRRRDALLEYMETESPWMDPDLTLSQLATLMKMNTSQLSWLVNQCFGKNFNDFINTYRVEAVTEKMKDPSLAHLSLLGLAFECGFNSKATFNRAFKKITGEAPSEVMSKVNQIT